METETSKDGEERILAERIVSDYKRLKKWLEETGNIFTKCDLKVREYMGGAAAEIALSARLGDAANGKMMLDV